MTKSTGTRPSPSNNNDASAGSAGHSGTSVKQGLHGQAVRAEERGRDEFQGNGASAAQDEGRTAEGGRHYGRPAIDEPAPDGGPPGPMPPGSPTVSQDEAGEDDRSEGDEGEAPARSQGTHSGGPAPKRG
ncbi:MAG: hypothetical protein JWM10_630 [Myxococcaceae bacterium]|nr:hypothetical protein [Myxococcaceae bacterium]